MPQISTNRAATGDDTDTGDTPSPDQRSHALSMELSDWKTWVRQAGLPAFRAGQIWRWMWQRRARSFDDMTDLPKTLRQQLGDAFQLFNSQTVAHQKASDGTEKLLVRQADGGEVECVLLRDGKRRSICVSSQVGCAMGCV
ncbi:MAG: 23S rRNA (adenine(2503)-C(2))-methyltransferase RlmN, partial [Planctomycetota bacterium]